MSCFKVKKRVDAMMASKRIYHERQVKELCALHALNNLFQARGSFSKQQLDTICRQLSPSSWFNPHKSLLGIGNYDINVIMAALQTRHHEAIWFDKRLDPDCLNLDQIYGFILNVPNDYHFAGLLLIPLRRKHWIALKQVDVPISAAQQQRIHHHKHSHLPPENAAAGGGVRGGSAGSVGGGGEFYNLDSKLDGPVCLGKADHFITYLRTQLASKDTELFVVVSRDVEQKASWRRPSVPAAAVAQQQRDHLERTQERNTQQHRDHHIQERNAQQQRDHHIEERNGHQRDHHHMQERNRCPNGDVLPPLNAHHMNCSAAIGGCCDYAQNNIPNAKQQLTTFGGGGGGGAIAGVGVGQADPWQRRECSGGDHAPDFTNR